MSAMDESVHYDEILFRHLTDEIRDFAIFMIDTRGVIVTWNPGVKRLLGFSEEDFVGEPFDIIFMPTDAASGIPAAELERARESGRAEDDRWHRRIDGSTFWASGLVTRVTNEQGSVIGFVKIMRDLTEKRKLESTLVQHSERLARANGDLKNFAGMVSHDLQAPLQTMLGFASLASQQVEEGDSSIQDSLQRIIDGAQHMRSLVDGIMNLSIGFDQDIVVEEVEADSALATAVASLEGRIRDSGARVTFDRLPRVKAEVVHLTRVFQNLLENAIKYAVDGKTPVIHVSGTENAGKVRLTIEDNGIGVKPRDAERIFTLFERADTTSATKSGKGVGLAVCKRIMEQFGGSVSVRANPKGGSTFTLELQAADPPTANDRDEPVLSEAAAGLR